MEEYTNIIMILIILVSVLLPFVEDYIDKKKTESKIECLLLANDHRWISMEEIAGDTGVSVDRASEYIEWGVREGIILGNLENNMFERSHQRTHEDIINFIPLSE